MALLRHQSDRRAAEQYFGSQRHCAAASPIHSRTAGRGGRPIHFSSLVWLLFHGVADRHVGLCRAALYPDTHLSGRRRDRPNVLARGAMITDGLFTGFVKALHWGAGAIWRDKRANVAMVFGLMVVPMVVVTGLGLDFYRKLSYKARLDAAADATAIAAINTTQAFLNMPGQTLTG